MAGNLKLELLRGRQEFVREPDKLKKQPFHATQLAKASKFDSKFSPDLWYLFKDCQKYIYDLITFSSSD